MKQVICIILYVLFTLGLSAYVDAGVYAHESLTNHFSPAIADSTVSTGYLYFAEKPLNFINHHHILILVCFILLSIVIALLALLYVRHMKMKMRELEYQLLLKYRDLFDNMPIPYMRNRLINDASGGDVEILEVNKSFSEKMFNRNEVLAKKGKEIAGSKIKHLEEYIGIAKQIVQKKETFVGEYHIGASFYSVFMMPSKEPDVIDLFFVDVTRLKEAQKSQEVYNHKLSIAVDAANMIYWHYDVEHDVFTVEKMVMESDPQTGKVNKHLEKNKQVKLSEALLNIHPDFREKVYELFKRLIAGEIQKGHIEYRLSDLSIYGDIEQSWEELLAEVEPAPDGKVTSIAGVFLPTTERKMLEEELRRALDKAEESNRLISAFVANMSHEIRTPLNAIVGFSGLLASAESEEEKQDYIRIIETNNSLLLQLINDILDLSKIEAAMFDLNKSEVSVNEMLDEIVVAAKFRNPNENVKIVCEKGMDDCILNVSRYRLVQVLNNLMNNAIKYTQKGTITIGYNYRNEEEKLRFFVKDTGIGIPEDKFQEIFDRFVKLNPFGQGNGLGLSIAKMIVDAMKGDIWVESEVGKGTCFWISIPLS